MKKRLASRSSLALALLLAACASTPPGLPPAPLAEADKAVQAMIDARQMPGGELWIEHVGFGSYHRAYGQRAIEPQVEPLDEATIFDAASLTKAVLTSTLVQILRQQGKLDVEAPISTYVPECADEAHAAITVRHLLTHSSGLDADLPGNGDFKRNGEWHGIADAVELICALPMASPTGTQFKYSDLGFILLGVIVSRQAGEPLEDFAQHALFDPVGMADSSYLPLRRVLPARIAPTEKQPDGSMLRGVVHDPTARTMGGVAGHAGLFTTSADLARFARMLLNDGVMADGKRLLTHESVALLTQPQSPEGLPVRGMGWDIDTAFSRPRGKLYPKGISFGHTGFTGCSVWLDPQSKSFYILLANRVHPGGPTNTLPLYAELGTIAAEAAGLK